MKTTLRHATPDDAAAVHTIFLQQHVLAGTQRLPHSPAEYMQQRLTPADDVVRLVAEVNGDNGPEIVGFAELVTFPDNPRHRHVGEVNMITVHEDWQGKGIARRLLEAMIDLADNWMQITRLGLIVWAQNESAVHLYKSLGFEVEGTMPDYAFGEGRYVDALMMGRVIRSRTE